MDFTKVFPGGGGKALGLCREQRHVINADAQVCQHCAAHRRGRRLFEGTSARQDLAPSPNLPPEPGGTILRPLPQPDRGTVRTVSVRLPTEVDGTPVEKWELYAVARGAKQLLYVRVNPDGNDSASGPDGADRSLRDVCVIVDKSE